VSTELEEQQLVLSEVSHDLANRFHRSYYFLELLGDALDPSSQSAPDLLAGLRGTVEDIESMTRSALAFVRPIELRKLRVRLDDLTASMRQHVGMREIELRGDASVGKVQVLVDPARISEALSFLCAFATDGDDSQSPVVVELVDGDPVGLRVHRGPGVVARTRGDLQLALTTRIARLHGGTLHVEGNGIEAGVASSSMILRLPVAARGNEG